MNKDRITLECTTLDGEDFSGLKLKQFTATQVSFRSCSFTGSRFDQACFGGGTKVSEYIDCNFDRARIRAIAPGVARFVRCSFRDCEIQSFFGVTTEFIDCVFSGKIKKAVFHGSVPEEDRAELGRATNEFRGNDFTRAELIDVAFRGGIDLSKQRLPEGEGYVYLANAGAAIEEVWRNVIGWKDMELRREALAILKDLESDVEGGQEQLFISLNSVPRSRREAGERVHRELVRAAAPS